MTNSDELALLGRLVRQRRQRLDLDQGDLAMYGGPGVSTVGKIERAEQGHYPPRTRHQIENALGWRRGTFDAILTAPGEPWWDDAGLREDFERGVVEDDVPDLSHPIDPAAQVRRAAELSDAELLAELTYRMQRYARETHSEPAPTTPARDDLAEQGTETMVTSRSFDVVPEVIMENPPPLLAEDPTLPPGPGHQDQR